MRSPYVYLIAGSQSLKGTAFPPTASAVAGPFDISTSSMQAGSGQRLRPFDGLRDRRLRATPSTLRQAQGIG